jgi:hypothetical protein
MTPARPPDARLDAALFLTAGSAIAVSFAALARLGSRQGSVLHLSLVGIAAAAYALSMLLLFRGRAPGARTLALCLGLALAARAPLVVKPAGTFDDSHRYVWDARLQRAGLNPYLVRPDDAAYDRLHTRETRLMNNRDVPSPYPPGAQLFFRGVTTFGESVAAFKTALLAAEVATMLLLVAWLGRSGRHPAWALAYAWHPVVIFETVSAAHLDALGAMLVVAALAALAYGRRLAASVALAASVSVKLLPIVLAPLLFRRVRWMHAAAAAALVGLAYVPFLDGWRVPPGSLGAFVDRFRFNQILFDPIAAVAGARPAAALAAAAGLVVAAAMRARGRTLDPAAWAWPLAAALLCSPVIYPWYLVWITPFVISRGTLPLLVWSLSIIPTYAVWQLAREGAAWAVPGSVLALEYGAVAVTAAVLLARPR